MRNQFTIIIFLVAIHLNAQNCEAFKLYGDTLQYDACVIAEEAEKHYQFSKEYQQIYDKSIQKCNYFSTAYHAKSVAYLKSGDFIEWKRLMDIAVSLKPIEYLGYRGWCRFEFCRDYIGAIKDIERLDSLVDYDIGFSSDGEYHLDIAKAICYKKIGERTKAIQIIGSKLNQEGYTPGLYDYFHLGVLYLETQNPANAVNMLEQQITINEFAECHYYLALANKKLNNSSAYQKHLQIAKGLYNQGKFLTGSYTSHIDKIYLKDIEDEINYSLE